MSESSAAGGSLAATRLFRVSVSGERIRRGGRWMKPSDEVVRTAELRVEYSDGSGERVRLRAVVELVAERLPVCAFEVDGGEVVWQPL